MSGKEAADVSQGERGLTRENRPWTRWWWLGNALNEREITRHLTLFHEAGIGGVEISPIYGVKGYEARNVPYLSDRWIELLSFTLQEAHRLGMGVDMIAGTGWPFGGPWVDTNDAARRLLWEVFPAPTPELKSARAPDADLLGVSGPDADGHVTALFLSHTRQQVKRAAPGGEGNVVDHYSASAMKRYFAAFDKPLSRLPGSGESLRCFFNDSFEVFGANGTPDLLKEFEKRRGYDPRPYFSAWQNHKGGDPELASRVRSDYRETMGELVYENLLGTFRDWAHAKGAKIRNQSHGSPGNLLDIYAIADIPETEVFGPPRLAAHGLKALRPVPGDFGAEEEPLVCRMASSAAHVAGRPYASSESFTWLGEHGCVPLEHARAEVDTLFTLGINHIFFHGTPFSPEDIPWPGWLFYASTHCAPTNSWWADFAVLNQYITRCQSFLQAGVPDNDVLVYFPYYDIIASETGAHDELQFLTVGRTATWLKGNLPDFTKTCHDLEKQGRTFDLVSDRQLRENIDADASVPGGLVAKNGGAKWRTLLISGCHRMPPETLERIAQLAQSGVSVLFLGESPADVPGLGKREERFARLKAAQQTVKAVSTVHFGSDLEALLDGAKIHRETLTDHGLEFIRRRNNDDTFTYFIANPGTADWKGWMPLARGAKMSLFDAVSGKAGLASGRVSEKRWETYLDLPAGSSLLLRTIPEAFSGQAWEYYGARGEGTTLKQEWEVAFTEGGPALPPARKVTRLTSWTNWDDEETARTALRAFSGTARYTHTFDLPPQKPDGWALDLGEVCYSARVRLNGKEVGTVIARPWRVMLPAELLQPTGNRLEIEVTNLMANRLSHLERTEGDKWRPFFFVNINYKPFDAAHWEPLPSGLLGPVRLIPLYKENLER